MPLNPDDACLDQRRWDQIFTGAWASTARLLFDNDWLEGSGVPIYYARVVEILVAKSPWTLLNTVLAKFVPCVPGEKCVAAKGRAGWHDNFRFRRHRSWKQDVARQILPSIR